jgi:hypothetical protein
MTTSRSLGVSWRRRYSIGFAYDRLMHVQRARNQTMFAIHDHLRRGNARNYARATPEPVRVRARCGRALAHAHKHVRTPCGTAL